MTKLANEFNYYLQILKELYLELELLPAGSLIKIKENIYARKLNGKYIGITKDPKMICELARKKFVITFIKHIKDNFKLMRKNLTCFPEKVDEININNPQSLHPRDIIESLPKSYQGLSESYFYHPFATDWLAEIPVQNDYKNELKTYKSKNGELFRSRGEQSFANLLEDNGLPYKSDVELTLGGTTKFPDFIILNPYIGQLFVVEFFGLADQLGYDEQMNNKMDWYRMNNCNIIYLFESDMRDSQHLQNLIDEKIWRI